MHYITKMQTTKLANINHEQHNAIIKTTTQHITRHHHHLPRVDALNHSSSSNRLAHTVTVSTSPHALTPNLYSYSDHVYVLL